MMWWDSAIFELGGLEFGHARGRIRTVSWESSGIGYRTQDVDRPGGDGVVFGTDRKRGGSWTIGLRTLAEGEAGAQSAVADLVRVWQPPEGALTTVPLRYRMADRWRRVYGRPRGISLPTTDVMVHQGRADIEATFDLSDSLHYDDAASSLTLGLSPASPRAWRFPMAPPFTWLSADAPVQVRQAVVGGDAPTPLRAIFRGPVTDPWLQIGGVRVALVGSLAYDEVVTVDARLMTVRRQDWASVPGRLAPRVRMADLVLPPGTHEVSFGGVDATGTATATLEWRAAWRSL